MLPPFSYHSLLYLTLSYRTPTHIIPPPTLISPLNHILPPPSHILPSHLYSPPQIGTGYDSTNNTTSSSGVNVSGGGIDGVRSYGPISGTYVKQKAKAQGLASSIPPPPPPPG